jgi:pyruvate dehydrogenase E2 component (dihydrolipoamide acetyltransferase)
LSEEIVMPAFEMAQEVGTLLRWLKSEGDVVSKGDLLMEIETDKATMEIEASANGILARITAQAGDEVKVGTVIAQLLTEEELLDESGLSHSDDRQSVQSIESVSSPTPDSQAEAAGDKTKTALFPGPKASPKVRRLASEHGIDLATVVGSGLDGTITSADLEQILRSNDSSGRGDSEYNVVPITGKRKIIATRLQQSYRDAPHVALTAAIDLTKVLASIKQQNASSGSRLRITHVLLRTVASTLPHFPKLNAHLVGEEIREYRAVHLGVAVDLEGGLIVPVLRDAEKKSLRTIQSGLEDLLARSRTNRLLPQELKGGTFTVSNLGMFGVEQFSAIVNPPEVAILAVGAYKDTPVSVDGKVELRPMVTVTLNVDHRAVNGADAARFLSALKQTLEKFDASSDD